MRKSHNAADDNINDAFTVSVTDNEGDTTTDTLDIRITDTAPVAVDDSGVTVTEDTPFDGDVSGNDTLGADASTYSVEAAGEPSNGSVLMNTDGTYTYTPDANFNGSDSFTYTITDADGDTSTATVSITVDAVADLIAEDDILEVDEDSGTTSASVAGNDSTTSGGTLSFALDTDVTNGTLVFNADGSYDYTPDANYNGSDSFTYIVTDPASGESSTQTVGITVNPVNDPPVAVDDEITILEDETFTSTIDLDANDTDIDGDDLTVSPGVFTTTLGGEITIASDGSYTYVPPEKVSGVDTVDYTVLDGNGGSDTGTLTINITEVDDDAFVRLTQNTDTISEDGGTVTYTIDILNGPGPSATPLPVFPGDTITVTIGYSGTATDGTDYQGPGGVLTTTIDIPAGSSSATFTIDALDDLDFEGNETINVEIIGLADDTSGFDSISEHPENQVTTTIVDNEGFGVTSISDATNDEGSAIIHSVTTNGPAPVGGAVVSIQVTPLVAEIFQQDYNPELVFTNGVTFVAGTQVFSIVDGTLTASINIPEGVDSFDVLVPSVDDTFNEVNETYTLTIDTVSAVGTIIDTDLPFPIADTATVSKPGWLMALPLVM